MANAIIDQVRDLTVDDLLHLVGIHRRSSFSRFMNTVETFGSGLLVGAGLGLLFAPKPGRQLRDDIRRKTQRGAVEVKERAQEAAEAVVGGDGGA